MGEVWKTTMARNWWPGEDAIGEPPGWGANDKRVVSTKSKSPFEIAFGAQIAASNR